MNGSMGDSNNKKSFGLLIVTSQTFSKEQKEHVLNKIKSSLIQNNDLLSSSIAVNLEQELDLIIKSNPFDNKYNYDQEFCIKSKKENFEFELLINSTLNTFKQALSNFLQSECKLKSFICAGIDQNAHANLVFQDSLFSFDDFLSLLNESKNLKNNEYNLNLCFNSKLINDNSNWKNLEKHSLNAKIIIKLLSPSQSDLSSSADSSINIEFFIDYLRNYLNERNICDFMEETKLTGTLNVEKPSLYIFPAKEGDCSFFTFNGYSMLINGGYDRIKPCFWRFTSMLKQIDSILVTHNDTDAVAGLSSFFAKKLTQPSVKPNVISLFGNFVASQKNHQNSEFLNDSDLIIDAAEKLKIKVQPLVKHESNSIKHHQQPEHINLYYKFGYGSLDLYVLSPFANSNEYKEFIHQTKSSIHKSQLSVNQIFKTIPISHLCSAVVLLVWTPSKQNENALRMLFTGNAPQHVIIHALEKVKEFDILQSPLYKIKSETHQHTATTSNKRSTVINTNVSANNSLNNGKDTVKDSVKDVKDIASKDTNKPISKPNTNNANNTTTTEEKAKSHATTNSASSATKTNVNGSSKQSSTSTSTKPPKPTNLQNGTSNGTSHKKEQSNSNGTNETKKAESFANNKKASTIKESKEDSKEKEETKDKEFKKATSTVSTKPSVAKKDEHNKSKTESSNTTRASTSTTKTETNVKPSSSTVSSAPVSATQAKRTSLAKAPNKSEKSEATKTEQSQSTTATALPPAASRKSTAKTIKENVETKDHKKEQTTVNKSSKQTTGKSIQTKDEKKTKATSIDSKTSQVESSIKAVNEVKSVASCVSTTDVVPIVDNEIIASSTVSAENHEPIVEKLELHEVKETIEDPIEHADGEIVKTENLVELKDNPSDPLDNEEVVRTEQVHQIETNVDNDFHSNEVESNIECEIRNCDQLEQNTEELNDIDKVDNFIVNQNVEEHECEVNCDFGTEDDDNEIASDASPNLSPVKRTESKDSIELEENEACIAEIKNENIDDNVMINLKENLELCLGEGTHQQEQQQQQETYVVDAEELIKTPQPSTEASPTQEMPPTDDIMTRSFIDNGTGDQNPFNLVNKDNKEDNIINFDKDDDKEIGDGENNVTPQLPQFENCLAVTTEVDSLIDGFKTMNIEQQINQNHAESNNENLANGNTLTNGDHEKKNDLLVDILAEVKQVPDQPINEQNTESDLQSEATLEKCIANDPNKWNLLELPKPVNPNEENNTTNSTVTASVPNDKKSTPNTKKVNPRSSSPSATAKSSNEANKSNQKGVSLNNSISKTATSSSTKASGPATKPSSPLHPLYFEVSYIPAHGNQYYVDSEFFKRVRARFYVLSTIEPSQHILNALIEAKQTWEDKELQVSIIPTYESDVLRHWFELNSKTLANLKIDILPSANLTKLTIDENPEFSYQVYKLEF